MADSDIFRQPYFNLMQHPCCNSYAWATNLNSNLK